MTDQPEKLDLSSLDFTEEKKQELLRLFPEIHTEAGRLTSSAQAGLRRNDRCGQGTLRDELAGQSRMLPHHPVA